MMVIFQPQSGELLKLDERAGQGNAEHSHCGGVPPVSIETILSVRCAR